MYNYYPTQPNRQPSFGLKGRPVSSLEEVRATSDESKTIYINENLSSTRMRKVLCHEITHAAMFSYNVELNIQQEELLADLIATYGQEIIDITNKIFTRMKE